MSWIASGRSRFSSTSTEEIASYSSSSTGWLSKRSWKVLGTSSRPSRRDADHGTCREGVRHHGGVGVGKSPEACGVAEVVVGDRVQPLVVPARVEAEHRDLLALRRYRQPCHAHLRAVRTG